MAGLLEWGVALLVPLALAAGVLGWYEPTIYTARVIPVLFETAWVIDA